MACQETATSMSSAGEPADVPGDLCYEVCPLQAPAAGLVGHDLLIGTGQLLGEKCEILDGTAAEPDCVA